MIIRKEERYFIYLIPFIEPQMFKVTGFELFDKIFLALKTISFLCIFTEFIINKFGHISKYLICLFMMILVQIFTFISTVLNHGSIVRILGPAIAAISMLMLGSLIFECNWKKYFKYIEKYLLVFFILNTITYIMKLIGFPLRTNFMGIDNRWIYFLLPWSIIAFINDYNENGKFTYSIKIYILSLVSLACLWSVGAMLVFIAMPFVYLLVKLLYGKYNILKCYISRMVFWIFLILNYLLTSNLILKMFSVIINKYLKKDITLSGRTHIWRGVFEVLEEKPWFGIGMQSNEYDMDYFFKSAFYAPGTRVNHPHNHLLYIAYHGGILSLIAFLILIYIVMKKIDKMENGELSCIYLTSAISIFIAALADTMDFSLFYLLIPIIMCAPVNQTKNKSIIKILELTGRT